MYYMSLAKRNTLFLIFFFCREWIILVSTGTQLHGSSCNFTIYQTDFNNFPINATWYNRFWQDEFNRQSLARFIKQRVISLSSNPNGWQNARSMLIQTVNIPYFFEKKIRTVVTLSSQFFIIINTNVIWRKCPVSRPFLIFNQYLCHIKIQKKIKQK